LFSGLGIVSGATNASNHTLPSGLKATLEIKPLRVRTS
jgi:hypothetical protein